MQYYVEKNDSKQTMDEEQHLNMMSKMKAADFNVRETQWESFNDVQKKKDTQEDEIFRK